MDKITFISGLFAKFERLEANILFCQMYVTEKSAILSKVIFERTNYGKTF